MSSDWQKHPAATATAVQKSKICEDLRKFKAFPDE